MRTATGLALVLSFAMEAQHPAQSKAAVSPVEKVDPPLKIDSPRSEAPAPFDLSVAVTDAGNNGLRLTVKRQGYVVALVTPGEVAVADDRVSARVESVGTGDLELVWETTAPRSLSTDRGGLRVTVGPEGPRVAWFGLADPAAVALHQDRLHACRAHAGLSDGYTVLCRVAKGARKISVSNATEPELQSNVWLSSGVVRLDLPVHEGEAPARIIGYMDGLNAVVVRAEASWVRGEGRPTLALFTGTRRQPVVPPSQW